MKNEAINIDFPDAKEVFSAEERLTAKKQITILAILCPIALAFDFGISYYTYTIEPWIFINNEASEGFVNFLLRGDMPIVLIMVNAVTLFVIFFAYDIMKKEKIIYKSSGLLFIIIGAVFTVYHIVGGLSWLPTLLEKF
jgi:hypothetical protein